MLEDEKSEDYMGMISWHKNTGTPKTLFGTEIQSNPITITIKRATECRELNRNWYLEHGKLVEIEMSPIQWAEFLVSGNTSGVPCTLRWLIKEGYMSEPKAPEIAKQYDDEVKLAFDEFGNSLDKISNLVKSVLDSNKSMTKKQMEELLSIIDVSKHKVVADAEYVKESFKEDMEGMVTKAKAEFNAYVENRVHEIGIEELKKGNVKFLEDKE